jgi:melibiose permease
MNKEYEIDDKIASKVKWSFAIGGLGKDMMFAMSTLMLGFFTIYVGVPVGIVGTIIMIARIWDAINDPIMGTIVDNTKSKFGKFRPWILIGTILNAIILIFVFFKPDLAPDSFWMIFYVSVFYILWGMSYTLMDIPFWSMIPTFSQSQKERESISVLTRIFTSIGYIIISAPWLIVVTLLGGGQTRTEILHGFFLLAIIVSIVFIITQLLVCKNAKEKYTTTNEEPTTLRKMISMLKSNDQLLVVMVTVLIFNFVLYTTSSMATFFFIFDINRDLTYDIKYLLFLFLAIGGVFQVASLFVYPLLSKFLKRRQIFQLSIIVSIVGFFGLFITAFFLKNNIYILFPIGVLVFLG